MRKTIATGALAGALLAGGAGAALIVPTIVTAADPTATPSTPSSDGATPVTPGAPGTSGDHGRGGRVEAVSEASVVAKAIGISESDLNTALQGGKTIADVAKANNVDVQRVIDALVADARDELAAAVEAGTMTQAQADAETSGLTQFATNQVNGTGFGPGGHGGGMRAGMGGGDFAEDTAIVAKVIGISESDLTTALHGGKTIADVAKANGVDAQKVIDALVTDKKDEIAAALKAGTITQAQADTKLANVTQFATDQVNRTGGGPVGHGGMDGRGHDGPGSATPGSGSGANGGTSG